MIKNCKICDIQFKPYTKSTNFCSNKCASEYRKSNYVSLKITKVCLVCKKNFETFPSANNIFCSRNCSAKGRKPKKSGYKVSVLKTEEQIKRIKERTLKYYQETSKEILEKRWENISKANKVHLTNEDVLKLEEVLVLGYVKDKKLIMKAANIVDKSYKALNNYINENLEWWKNFKFFKGQLDWKVQNLKPTQFKELLQDLYYFNTTFVQNKWDIGEKTQTRLRKFYNITNEYGINKKETRIEAIIRNILKELTVDFEREKYLCRRFRVDFLIGKKVIEVNGDYWHGNPLIYKYEKLDKYQWTTFYNDIFKKEWLQLNGYDILYIWESELVDLNAIQEKIKNFIQ
jgi:hypothetical protein